MGLVVNTRENQVHWIKYIEQRIRKNKNFIGFVGGPTGSGKSWSCLSIAEMLNPGFDIKNCVFSPKELMSRINSGELKTGSVIIFEEAGVSINSKNWQSVVNKILNYLFQTFRHRRFILIMNSPYMDFIDGSTRKLFHSEFKTIGIDVNRGVTILKPQIIQYNDRKDKFYYKFLRVVTGRGTSPVKKWAIKKPPQTLIDLYEAKKIEFTTKLNREIEEQMYEKEQKETTETKRILKCKNCNYEWKPKSKGIPRCPKCSRNMAVEVTAPILDSVSCTDAGTT